jgi:hypothetical protein
MGESGSQALLPRRRDGAFLVFFKIWVSRLFWILENSDFGFEILPGREIPMISA